MMLLKSVRSVLWINLSNQYILASNARSTCARSDFESKTSLLFSIFNDPKTYWLASVTRSGTTVFCTLRQTQKSLWSSRNIPKSGTGRPTSRARLAHIHSETSERKPVWLPLHHRMPPLSSLQIKGFETPCSETFNMDSMHLIEMHYTKIAGKAASADAQSIGAHKTAVMAARTIVDGGSLTSSACCAS